MINRADIAIIGGGIVGLAHAYAAAKCGYHVVLFDQNEQAVGASIRNFGLVWPIGVPAELYARAMVGRETWLALAGKAGFWCRPNGSLILAYHTDERDVLAEFFETSTVQRPGCQLLSAQQVIELSPAVRAEGLLAGLWSPTELTLEPREAIRRLPFWLAREHGVELRFGTPIHHISMPIVENATEAWKVDHVLVCCGADFETLYPNVFATANMTKCKLQMMRTVPQPDGWQLGPTLAAGLSIARYDSFAACASWTKLTQRLERDLPEYAGRGIHVLLAQNHAGELLIGDSHEYGPTIDPFDKEPINQLILQYLSTFAQVPRLDVAERWHGVYPRLSGQSEFIARPKRDVTIVCDTGGLGMTLSFGLAEEIIKQL
jgi:FAD dependent oxidoreductase TIGR03364